MSDFRDSTTVHADPTTVFSYLADVSHLPQYFARMTSAKPGEGEEVVTTAALPDGSEVEGRAWFRVDEDDQHLAWGAEGDNDYHGGLDVRPDGDGCVVEVTVHTSHVDDGDTEVEQGIRETLANIKNLVESR